MTWIDAAVLVIVVLSAAFSMVRGFVREVLGVGAWIGASLAAVKFYPLVLPEVSSVLPMKNLVVYVAMAIIFIIVLIVFLVKQSGSTQKPTPPSAHINHLIGEIIELKNEIKNLKTEININADKLTKQIENLPLAHRRYQPNSETNVTPVNEEVTPIPPAQEIITEQPIAAEPFILNPETQPVTNEEKENI